VQLQEYTGERNLNAEDGLEKSGEEGSRWYGVAWYCRQPVFLKK